ncbi:MAG: hypothetical protein LUC49_06885 [Prevotella sp.]|nr:hypothetical protein [Prevotella sp.]
MVTEKQLANLKLRPFTSEQSRDEAATNGRKGGVASGKKRRLKGNLRKIVLAMGKLSAPASLNQQANELLGTDEEYSCNALSVISLYQEAWKGNIAAARMIAQLDGSLAEKPEQGAPRIILKVSSETKERLERAKREGIT